MADQIVLRPVVEDDLAIVEELSGGDPARSGAFGWYGWRDRDRWRRRWADNGLLGEDGGSLIVARDQERLGFVNWRIKRPTPNAYHWEIGISLLPEARGHGYGTEAQRLLVRYLFAHTPVHRIEAATDAGNVAEQRALEKAGFTREGLLRGIGWRDGAWRDGVWYSVLRTDLATDPPSDLGR
jgi:RimJ/RimL family protein N-acetyltransferase